MKNHPTKLLPGFYGENSTDPEDRIRDESSPQAWGLIVEPTGRISKWGNFYPICPAEVLGVEDGDPKQKVWNLARVKLPSGVSRLLGVVGGNLLRTGPSNIFDTWVPITFPTDIDPPLLNQDCAIAFRQGYGYVFNIDDLPFRIKMEEADGSAPPTLAEVLGLRPPLYPATAGTHVAGTRFPQDRPVAYAVTFVYGDRGESGPSPTATAFNNSNSYDTMKLTGIPIGPSGVTARRIYRTRIGVTPAFTYTNENARNVAYKPVAAEMFFLGELPDNTETTFDDSIDDSGLDYSTRLPPARPFPPRAKYCVVHQDRLAWANLHEHPWVFAIVSDPFYGSGGVTVTISNTGSGSIAVTVTGGTHSGTVTVSDYKTKTLREIWQELVTAPVYSLAASFTAGSAAGQGTVCRVAPGIDWDRTYVFREVTSQSVLGHENVLWLEAIEGDAIAVDGCRRYPNGFMWSNPTFPEEINPLQTWYASRHDAYPITGMFHDDYTLGLSTEDAIFVLTGSLSVNEFWEPDFTVSRTQSEHGSICTRTDAMATTPIGIIFIASDGFRIFRGQASTRWKEGRQLNKRVMQRLKRDYLTRGNFFMHYHEGVLYGWFAGEEVA